MLQTVTERKIMENIFEKMTEEQTEELAKNPFRAVESLWYGVYAIRPLDRDMGIGIEQTPEEFKQIHSILDKINLAVKELEDLGFFIGAIQTSDGVGMLMNVPDKMQILSAAMEMAFGPKGGEE